MDTRTATRATARTTLREAPSLPRAGTSSSTTSRVVLATTRPGPRSCVAVLRLLRLEHLHDAEAVLGGGTQPDPLNVHWPGPPRSQLRQRGCRRAPPLGLGSVRLKGEPATRSAAAVFARVLPALRRPARASFRRCTPDEAAAEGDGPKRFTSHRGCGIEAAAGDVGGVRAKLYPWHDSSRGVGRDDHPAATSRFRAAAAFPSSDLSRLS
jgi:hypothetical protein